MVDALYFRYPSLRSLAYKKRLSHRRIEISLENCLGLRGRPASWTESVLVERLIRHLSRRDGDISSFFPLMEKEAYKVNPHLAARPVAPIAKSQKQKKYNQLKHKRSSPKPNTPFIPASSAPSPYIPPKFPKPSRSYCSCGCGGPPMTHADSCFGLNPE